MKTLLTALACIALMSLDAVAGGKPPLKPPTAEDTEKVNAMLTETLHERSRFAEFTKAAFENNGRSIRVWMKFNNSEFKRFWTHEVAAQYIFDAALRKFTAAVLDSKEPHLHNTEKVVFVIDIHPHDIPPVLEWEISRKAWVLHKTQHTNEGIFKASKLTAGGKEFKFDPVMAADIE